MNLEKLPKKDTKVEGYVWDSNAKHPKVYRDQPLDISKYFQEDNPYIVEALLYSKDENCAWMIKHTGTYQINQYDLNALSKEGELVEVDFLPHRLKKNNPDGATPIKKVCFKQLWIPEEDPNCENMNVLKMQALIFTGFNQQPKKVEDVRS